MERLEIMQEPIAQLGEGTRREHNPMIAPQLVADLPPLPVPMIAGQAHRHDQVITVTLSPRDQSGQLLRYRSRVGGTQRAALADLSHPNRAGLQRADCPFLTLLYPQGTAALPTPRRLGNKIDAGKRIGETRGATCGVRIAIHGTNAELIVRSCDTSSDLTTIQR